jgi:hypothetical protein
MVEGLPIVHKALDSIPSSTKGKKKWKIEFFFLEYFSFSTSPVYKT